MRYLKDPVRRVILILALLAGIVYFLLTPLPAPFRKPYPPPPSAPVRNRALPTKAPLPGPRVVLLRKADRRLAYYKHGRLSATYPIALGSSPVGHKQQEGDARTPEGTYYVCYRNPDSPFHRFLGLSYPNAQDAETGFRSGLISWYQLQVIRRAVRNHQRPSWDTPLGGEVGIHGGGTGNDWTLGCIAVEDEAIDKLWEELEMGDPVVIEK